MGGGSAHLLPTILPQKPAAHFLGSGGEKGDKRCLNGGERGIFESTFEERTEKGMREGGSRLRLFWNFLASDFLPLCRADKVKE